jgi:hypothetical protein
MKNLFKILQAGEGASRGDESVTLAIQIRVGDQEVDCPISKICRSEDELVEAVRSIQDNLERVLEKGKNLLSGSSPAMEMGIQPGMTGREIWAILSQIPDEGEFVACFNTLEDKKRIEVAEHVLTECNVFSGKGATFSARYNGETTLME